MKKKKKKKKLTLKRSVVFIGLLAYCLTLHSCKTTSSRSGLSEVDPDAPYSNQIEVAHLSVYSKKQASTINGVNHSFYALPSYLKNERIIFGKVLDQIICLSYLLI